MKKTDLYLITHYDYFDNQIKKCRECLMKKLKNNLDIKDFP